MWSRIRRWLFGAQTSAKPRTRLLLKIRTADSGDPYRNYVLDECWATKSMVGGHIDENGDLILAYESGATRRIPRAEVMEKS